jgi:hypothetical protein
LARDLLAAGIETFYADWSIAAGDSLRQRIDQGIADCTHFVVLLTTTSIDKPWVNAEIDAAFVRKVAGQARFVPLRYALPVERLTPLLRSLLAPEVTDATFQSDLDRLVNDIYGVSRKPPLGELPAFHHPRRAPGFSTGASRVAALFVQRSNRGRRGDPSLSNEELTTGCSLTTSDLGIAVDELRSHSLVEPVALAGGYNEVEPMDLLFVTFDSLFTDWNPVADAVRLAADLANGERPGLSIPKTAERYGWPPRRMNPALTHLMRCRAVLASEIGDPDYITLSIRRTPATARFVRDNE